MKAGGREACYPRRRGLVSFTRDGHEMLSRKPSLLTFRPLTDNDRGNALRPSTVHTSGCRPLRQDGRYRNPSVMAIRSSAHARMNWQSRNARRSPHATGCWKTGESSDPHLSGGIGESSRYRPFGGMEWMLPVEVFEPALLRSGTIKETYRDRPPARRQARRVRGTAEADNAPYPGAAEPAAIMRGCAGLSDRPPLATACV